MPFMYILECADGTYYTGSTKDLDIRFMQHRSGMGANYTGKTKPMKIAYYEEFARIDDAFFREKQVQRWSHAKKKAIIDGNFEELIIKSKKDFARPSRYAR